MAPLLARDDRPVGHPVHLDGAPLAVEGLVAVPGILRAAEDEQGAAMRRHFLGIVGEIGAVAQDAQPPAVLVPLLVHVEEHGDDLGGRIGVDLAVARPAFAAHREHGRARDSRSMLNFSSMAWRNSGPFELVEQRLEMSRRPRAREADASRGRERADSRR